MSLRPSSTGILTAAALLATGCVSSGTHEQLQKDYDALKAVQEKTQQELKTSQGQSQTLEQALAAAENEKKELEAEQARLQEEQKRLQGEQARLSDELATVVKDKSKLKASVDDMKKALEELQARKAEAEKRIAEYKTLLGRFKSLIDAGKLKVKIVDGRMVVALATDVLFPSGSAQLSKDGQAAIAEVASVLASIPDRKFQVEGHTDNVPIKTALYKSNWDLAAARAVTVVNKMVEASMPPDRISAASFGEHKPVAANETPEGRTQNRRIEIVVVPDLSSLPGFDELQKVGG
ncbi:MAG: OmpA family protein [Deltaproteobacteria bacterium]|nr:OmpA family protein [Deltaproteobacteria bacterium]